VLQLRLYLSSSLASSQVDHVMPGLSRKKCYPSASTFAASMQECMGLFGTHEFHKNCARVSQGKHKNTKKIAFQIGQAAHQLTKLYSSSWLLVECCFHPLWPWLASVAALWRP